MPPEKEEVIEKTDRERMIERRAELQAELNRGSSVAQQQRQQLSETEQTLIRIGGAIQILSELIGDGNGGK